MRPESSNSASPAGSRKPGAAQAATSSSAAPAQMPRIVLRIETLERLLQRLVFRADLERFLPDATRLVALAELPEHFAQVRADLAVRPAVPGAAQLRGRALQVAHAVQHPAQRVHDEEIAGRELDRALDQRLRLGQADVAV